MKIEESVNYLIELIERDTPMKVDSPNYYGFGYYKCPKCMDIVIEERFNYCPHCGQRLDWSE